MRSMLLAVALFSCGGGTAVMDAGTDGGGSTSPLSGYIVVTQKDLGAGGFFSLVQADFSEVVGTVSVSNPCIETIQGGCSVLTCGQSDGGESGDGGTTTPRSAGTVTVAGLAIDGGAAELTYDGSLKRYANRTTSARVFNGGDTLRASAAGDVVPAFSGKTLVAPAAVTLTMPVCAGGTCNISRASDLPVKWTGGGSGQVRVRLDAADLGASWSVLCIAPASAGQLTVPSSALMVFPANARGGLNVGATNAVDFNAGAYAIRFSANNIHSSGEWSVTFAP